MGWQDRNYDSRVNYGGNPFSHPLLKLIFGSVYIGTLFGIRIRIHASFIWYAGISLLVAYLGSGGGVGDTAFYVAALFGIVLLHEFGHCFAARSVGGEADEIMLWMLGGLAFAHSPRRPWAHFVTVAGGPLVNVGIFIILSTVACFGYHVWLPLDPLFPFLPGHLGDYKNVAAIFNLVNSPGGRYLFWIHAMNWSLLFFNLIPMFPLDGGQIFQAILWKPLGYVRATRIACYVGIVMSVLVGLFALRYCPAVIFIAVFALMGCVQQLRLLKMTGEEESEPYDLSAAWEHPDRPSGRAGGKSRRVKKRWFKSARKQASREQAEEARIDAILDKVKERGLHSLSWFEKRALRKATERQRQRDLAGRM